MALAMEWPDRFRLEFFGPVGGARLVMVSDGRSLRAALPSQRMFAEAEATPRSFQLLLGIPMRSEDLIALLTGELYAHDRAGWEGSRGSEARVVDRPLPGGGSLRYRIRPDAEGRIAEAEINAADGEFQPMTLHVLYADYQASPWGPLPHRLSLSRSGRSLDLQLKKTAPGSPRPEAFDLSAPKGFERVDLARFAAAGTALLGGDS